MEKMLEKELEEKAEKCSNEFISNLNKFRSNKILIDVISKIEIIDSKEKNKKIGSISNLKISNKGELIITPFDQKYYPKIIKSILNENLGYTLSGNSNNGEMVFFLSPMSKEIKENITKKISQEAEESKKRLRIIRQQFIKKEKKEKDEIDNIIKKHQEKIEEMKIKKNKEIMN